MENERNTTTVTEDSDTNSSGPTSSAPDNITIDLTDDDSHVPTPAPVVHEDDEIVFISHKKNRIVAEDAVEIVQVTQRKPPTLQPPPLEPLAPPEETPTNAKTLKCAICLDEFDTVMIFHVLYLPILIFLFNRF